MPAKVTICGLRTLLGKYGSDDELDDAVVEFLLDSLKEPEMTAKQMADLLTIYVPALAGAAEAVEKVAEQVHRYINTGALLVNVDQVEDPPSPLSPSTLDPKTTTTQIARPTAVSNSVDAQLADSGAVDGALLDMVRNIQAILSDVRVADIYAAIEKFGRKSVDVIVAYLMELESKEMDFEAVAHNRKRKAANHRIRKHVSPQTVNKIGGAATESVSTPTSALEKVKDVIPDVDEDVALYALARMKNNVESSIAYILEGGASDDYGLLKASTTTNSDESESLDEKDEAVKSAVMARFDEVLDTSDKVYKPTLPREMLAQAPKRQTRYRDGVAVVLGKGEKYITEVTRQENPDTFVTIKVKRKGARGPGPGWKK